LRRKSAAGGAEVKADMRNPLRCLFITEQLLGYEIFKHVLMESRKAFVILQLKMDMFYLNFTKNSG